MTAPRANLLDGSDWLKNSFSIWRGFGRDCDAAEHPAAFPVALASRLIECFAADPDGLILDPFAGSGSTMLAALHSGMTAVGFDINPTYRKMFEGRVTLMETNADHRWNYHVRDARQLDNWLEPGSVEMCFTSPPYWDILNRRRSADGKDARSYSTNDDDLGNMSDYHDFLDALAVVANQVGKVLRDRGYFVLNVMDLRKGPVFYPLHQDASTAVVGTGRFTLEDIIVWDRQADYNSMRPLGYPYKFIINKVHEYLLVFRRG